MRIVEQNLCTFYCYACDALHLVSLKLGQQNWNSGRRKHKSDGDPCDSGYVELEFEACLLRACEHEAGLVALCTSPCRSTPRSTNFWNQRKVVLIRSVMEINTSVSIFTSCFRTRRKCVGLQTWYRPSFSRQDVTRSASLAYMPLLSHLWHKPVKMVLSSYFGCRLHRCTLCHHLHIS